jgi:hypothetical protein
MNFYASLCSLWGQNHLLLSLGLKISFFFGDLPFNFFDIEALFAEKGDGY